MELIVVAVLSLGLGAAAGALWVSSRSRAVHETALQEKAALAAALEAERRAAVEKMAILENARGALKESFTALSADALRASNASFLQLATESFAKPLKESLQRIDQHLQQVDRDHLANTKDLSAQLRLATDTQERLRRETEGLVKALRSPNQRGRWGEITLRNIIERAGMNGFCGDFSEKEAAQDEFGRRAVPDMIVRLPNGSCIVIDSKVPIDAYLRAAEAQDEAQREALMRDHARQVREHIKGLAAKSYWAKFTPTPELVVMFLPGEPLFSTALQHDPTLFDFAADQRVIPASPLTLLALLRTVASAWQQQRLAEGAERVRALGAELYDRLALMAEAVQSMGLNLKQAAGAYDRFIGSLETRVLVTARRFKELGVSGTKDVAELEPLHLDTREIKAQELRLPIQESLIEGEILESERAPVEPI